VSRPGAETNGVAGLGLPFTHSGGLAAELEICTFGGVGTRPGPGRQRGKLAQAAIWASLGALPNRLFVGGGMLSRKLA
jgi:hypothetical protein